MKKVLFVASIGILLAIGARTAAADTITSGNILFTCINCAPNGTAPTDGSFSYDDTTNLFSKLTFAWDGFNAQISGGNVTPGMSLQSEEEDVFQKLIGVDSAPLEWDFHCVEGTEIGLPCADIFAMTMDNLGVGPASFPIVPAIPNNAANGTAIGTDIVTTTFNTPEPATFAFLLLGLPLLMGFRKRLALRDLRESK